MFALTKRQRIQWSLGSPARAIGFAGFTALLCWLAYVSIGLSAVLVIMIVVVAAHWVPYLLAGRSRLRVTDAGITDHLRFRTRHYAWEEIKALEVMTLHRSTHGLVVELGDTSNGSTNGSSTGSSTGSSSGDHSRTEFLRASWRPSLREAQQLLDSVRAAANRKA